MGVVVYETTSYQTDCPSALWREFKQQHADRNRINSRVVELVAEDVEQQTDDLDPQVREEINRILGGDA